MQITDGILRRLTKLPGYQWFVFSALLCMGVLVAREQDRLVNAHLWAEDGTVFLAEGLSKGPISLLDSYQGYFHTISRVMGLIGVYFVDLTWYPFYTRIFCLVITAFVFSSFTRQAYDWLIPSVFLRGIVAVLFCLLPGALEVFGNPANIHWILYLYLWLLALKPPSQVYRPWEMLLIFLCVASAGESIVIVPLILWRLYQQREMNASLKTPKSYSDFFFLSVLLGMALINFAVREDRGPSSFVGLGKLLQTGLVSSGISLVYLPLLGPDLYAEVSQYMGKNLIKGLGFLSILSAAVFILKKKGRPAWTFILGVGCAFGVHLLTFIVRPDSVYWFGRLRLPAAHYGHRYYFMLTPMGVMLWAVVVGILGFSTPKSRVVSFCMIALMAMGGLRLFTLPPIGLGLEWKEDVKRLISSRESGCPKEVTIPIYPPGWQFSYRSSKTEVCP